MYTYMFQAVKQKLGDSFVWQSLDELFPVFQYVVVRSHIQELGSEIHFIDDFKEDRFKHGEMDIMFITLKVRTFNLSSFSSRKRNLGFFRISRRQ